MVGPLNNVIAGILAICEGGLFRAIEGFRLLLVFGFTSFSLRFSCSMIYFPLGWTSLIMFSVPSGHLIFIEMVSLAPLIAN